MPRYRFYRVPETAKEMTFQELFVDCFQQGRDAGWEFSPLITDGGAAPKLDIFQPTTNIPLPGCLGDVIRLFMDPITPIQELRAVSVTLQAIHTSVMRNPRDMLNLIAQQIRLSPIMFNMVRGEICELATRTFEQQEMVSRSHGMRVFSTSWLPITREVEEWFWERLRPAAMLILLASSRKSDHEEIANEVIDCFIKSQSEHLTLSVPYHAAVLTALISCGLGTFSYIWAALKYIPVCVEYEGQTVLTLYDQAACVGSQADSVWVVETEKSKLLGKRLCLIGSMLNDGVVSLERLLFPMQLVLNEHHEI